MKRFRDRTGLICLFMVFIMLALQLPEGSARSSMISTERLLDTSEARQDRKRILTFLPIEDVKAKLVSLGVNSAEARSRVEALSDSEAREVAAQIDQLPAGQGAVGTILGIILIVFLVFLITDMVGATDVFPFVKKVRTN